MMNAKTLLFSGIEKLPECRLTKPLKEWGQRKLHKELTEVKISVTQGNWNLVMGVEELKRLLKDPRVPEGKKQELRERLTELDRKVAAVGKEIEELDKEEKETFEKPGQRIYFECIGSALWTHNYLIHLASFSYTLLCFLCTLLCFQCSVIGLTKY